MLAISLFPTLYFAFLHSRTSVLGPRAISQTPLNAITDTFFRKEALPIEDCTENILTEIWTQRVPRFLVLPELYKWPTSSVIDSFSN